MSRDIYYSGWHFVWMRPQVSKLISHLSVDNDNCLDSPNWHLLISQPRIDGTVYHSCLRER